MMSRRINRGRTSPSHTSHRSVPQIGALQAASTTQKMACFKVSTAAIRSARLSVFKIIQKSDYLKSPLASARGLNLAKTLESRRHKALIALLIERREALGMTQTQLADRLGEYQSFVARLESGQRRVDVVEFLELAEALGLDAGKALAAVRKVG